MSAKTGRAPQRTIELAEAKKVNGVVSTRSPGRNAGGSHGQPQGISAAGAGHRLIDSEKRRNFPLQSGNLFAKNQALRLANPVDGLANFSANGWRTAA